MLGEVIKRRRKALGLSAETVAEALDVSPATIYRYESGDITNPGLDKVATLAWVLDIPITDLVGENELGQKKEPPAPEGEGDVSDMLDAAVQQALIDGGWVEGDGELDEGEKAFLIKALELFRMYRQSQKPKK